MSKQAKFIDEIKEEDKDALAFLGLSGDDLNLDMFFKGGALDYKAALQHLVEQAYNAEVAAKQVANMTQEEAKKMINSVKQYGFGKYKAGALDYKAALEDMMKQAFNAKVAVESVANMSQEEAKKMIKRAQKYGLGKKRKQSRKVRKTGKKAKRVTKRSKKTRKTRK